MSAASDHKAGLESEAFRRVERPENGILKTIL